MVDTVIDHQKCEKCLQSANNSHDQATVRCPAITISAPLIARPHVRVPFSSKQGRTPAASETNKGM